MVETATNGEAGHDGVEPPPWLSTSRTPPPPIRARDPDMAVALPEARFWATQASIAPNGINISGGRGGSSAASQITRNCMRRSPLGASTGRLASGSARSRRPGYGPRFIASLYQHQSLPARHCCQGRVVVGHRRLASHRHTSGTGSGVRLDQRFQVGDPRSKLSISTPGACSSGPWPPSRPPIPEASASPASTGCQLSAGGLDHLALGIQPSSRSVDHRMGRAGASPGCRWGRRAGVIIFRPSRVRSSAWAWIDLADRVRDGLAPPGSLQDDPSLFLWYEMQGGDDVRGVDGTAGVVADADHVIGGEFTAVSRQSRRSRDLNPDGPRCQRCLRPSRLPVPPLRPVAGPS